MLSDIPFYLENFSREVRAWEQRFKKDKQDRLFIHYTLMSQNIREKVRLFLNPTIVELQRLKQDYAEKYRHKDLPYHLESALNNCGFLKTLLKELVDLYERQAPYGQISIRWDHNLASLHKRLGTLHARLLIIQKILAVEAVEHEKA